MRAVGVYTFRTLDKYVFLPTYRMFSCADLDGISHAYTDNTVSAQTVMLCGLVLPYVIIEVGSSWARTLGTIFI